MGRNVLYGSIVVLLLLILGGQFIDYSVNLLIMLLGLVIIILLIVRPGNPFNQRGFQRPREDFAGRVSSMRAQSFDSMAAQYISLASS